MPDFQGTYFYEYNFGRGPFGEPEVLRRTLYLMPSGRFAFFGHWRGFESAIAAGTWRNLSGAFVRLDGTESISSDTEWVVSRPFSIRLLVNEISGHCSLTADRQESVLGCGPFSHIGLREFVRTGGAALPSSWDEIEQWIVDYLSRPDEWGRAVGSAFKPDERVDSYCEVCGKQLTRRWGRYGVFLACTGFPECTYTTTAPLESTSSPTEPLSELMLSPEDFDEGWEYLIEGAYAPPVAAWSSAAYSFNVVLKSLVSIGEGAGLVTITQTVTLGENGAREYMGEVRSLMGEGVAVFGNMRDEHYGLVPHQIESAGEAEIVAYERWQPVDLSASAERQSVNPREDEPGRAQLPNVQNNFALQVSAKAWICASDSLAVEISVAMTRENRTAKVWPFLDFVTAQLDLAVAIVQLKMLDADVLDVRT